MEKNMHVMIIGAMVAIVLVGSLLVPIITDYTDTTETLYNNARGAYADASESDAVNITITTTLGEAGTTEYIVNGESVTIPTSQRLLVMADILTISQNYSYGLVVSGVFTDGIQEVTGCSSVTVSISNNGATITAVNSVGTTSLTANLSWCFYRVTAGDYTIVDHISTTRTLYLNSWDQLYSSNWISTTGEYFSMNGTDVSIYDSSGNIDHSTATADTTQIMDNVFSFTVTSDRTAGSFSFVVDNNGEDYAVFPFFIIVPNEVVGVTDQDAMVNAVLFMLPVVLIAGIVAIVAYGAVSRR